MRNLRNSMFIAMAILLMPNIVYSQLSLYVSVDGDDENIGSRESPMKSVEGAISRAVEGREIDSLIINFLPGVYHYNKTILLGKSVFDKALVLRSESGGVTLHGGSYISGSEFVRVKNKKVLKRLLPEVRDKVLFVDLKTIGINNYGELKQHGFGSVPEPSAMELFVNGEPQTIARYPNDKSLLMIGEVYDEGSVPRNGDFSNRGGEFGFEYDRVKRWRHAEDLWLHGKFSLGYNDDHLKVGKIDFEKSSFKIVQPHLYGLTTSTPAYIDSTNRRHLAGLSVRGYYAYNLLEEIDIPGEYYLDRKNGTLYLYPKSELNDFQIEVSIMEDPLISLIDADNVTIEGINFTCSRGMGIYMKECKNIDISGCDFSNFGTVAISMGQVLQNTERTYNLDGSPRQEVFEEGSFYNITVSNCKIFNTGTGGIMLRGGNRKMLNPSGNTVFNVEFYNTDRINQSYSPSIKLSGVGNVVQNCYFHDLHHQAISFQGNDHVIEYSKFERVCEDADDMGAIYTGRDPASRGTEIRYNYFTDIEPDHAETSMAGVYIDDGSGGMTVRNNLFYKVGNPGHYKHFAAIFYHGSHDMKAYENIFLNCKVAIGHSPWGDSRWERHLNSQLIQYKTRKEVDILGEIYQQRYPELEDFFKNPGRRLNLVQNNLTINTELVRSGDFMLRQNNTMDGQISDPEEIDFESAAKLFRSFEPFPFNKCGIIEIK